MTLAELSLPFLSLYQVFKAKTFEKIVFNYKARLNVSNVGKSKKMVLVSLISASLSLYLAKMNLDFTY